VTARRRAGRPRRRTGQRAFADAGAKLPYGFFELSYQNIASASKVGYGVKRISPIA
jgi:hypothetical protein